MRTERPPRGALAATDIGGFVAERQTIAVADDADLHGRRYRPDIAVQGPRGSALVRTARIVRTGEDFPRLTSCYVIDPWEVP